MIGFALRQLALWVGVLLLVIYAVSHFQRSPDPAAPASPPETAPGTRSGAAPNSLVFRANPQGHVVLDGDVNGAPVRFLVDTGASIVVLTMRDAAAAVMRPSDLDFTLRTSTANGVARAAPVRLREVRIGQLSLDDVDAAIVENLGVSLLGQSFLRRLDGYEMRDGVLTLTFY